MPTQIFTIAMLGAGWLMNATPATAQNCGLALVLATDVSSSIDEDEYRLQMDGLAEAFRTPVLRDALLGTPGQVVAATVVHWSGYAHQEQVVPWRVLSSPDALDGFADAIQRVPRAHADQPTALAKGLQFSARLVADMPCARKIIDLSGDGVSNWGVEPSYFAERGLFDALTINGLVIKGADPDPEPYYRENVARGPGAFVMVAQDYAAYPETILEKLLREIVPRLSER